MTLVTEIYKISKGLPKDEAYGLTSQMDDAGTKLQRLERHKAEDNMTLCLSSLCPYEPE